MDKCYVIVLSAIYFGFLALVQIRNIVVYRAVIRCINESYELYDMAEWNLMMWQINKWTYKDFYGDKLKKKEDYKK